MSNTNPSGNNLEIKNGRKPQKGSILLKVIAFLLVAVIAATGITWFMLYNDYEKQRILAETNTIYDNIFVNHVDVSGLTVEQAVEKLERDLIEPLRKKTISLVDEELQINETFLFSDFEAGFDIETAVETAYNYARQGELKDRIRLIEALADHPYQIEAQYTYATNQFSQILEPIATQLYIAPVDATVERVNGRFQITDEVVGRRMVTETTLEEMTAILSTGESGRAGIYMEELLPEHTAEQFAQATSLLGTFSSSFSGGSAGRTANITTASDKINDYVIYPGEIFSTNATFGAMTHDNGYRMAPVIVGGILEDGMGGGVCQVSSTLYMAVLFAELDIVERQNHSQKVSYMDWGFDATLAGDYIDFKFRNDTDYPVFIESVIENSKITVNIYGYEVHSPGRTLEFKNAHIETIPPPEDTVKEDPSLPLGETVVETSALSGQKYNLYKIVYENGVEVDREQVNQSYYRPRAAVVRVGTGEEAQPQADTQEPGENSPGEINSESTELGDAGDLTISFPDNLEEEPPVITD